MVASMNCKLVNDEMKHPGIYAIYNLSNEKFYIGSSKNVDKRCKHHLYELRNKRHRNSYLQRAYNLQSKYFIFFLIEKVEECDLLKREQFWMDELSVCDHGYNILPIAGSNAGRTPSEETRKKLSVALKGIKRSKETIERFKNRKFSLATRQKMSNSHKNMKHTEEAKKKISEAQWIPVNQLTKEGEFVKRWESMTHASKEGFGKQNISKCCKGLRKTHKGFKWEFAQILKIN